MKKIITLILFACTFNVFALDPIINIPDVNFKKVLIEKGVDKNNDGKIQINEAEAIKELYAFTKNIYDLTGIEAFVNLTTLYCSSNNLTTLNISENINLTTLYCPSNKLTNLDISKNINLTYLDCGFNKLTSLDISTNTALTNLTCNNNDLTSLDLSKNINLTKLYCSSNLLTNLDVSKNIALSSFNCGFNKLTNLDISTNTALTELNCSSTKLTNLDVSKNTDLVTLLCSNNPILQVICVNSNQDTTSWKKDAIAKYSTTCDPISSTESQINNTTIIIKAYNLQGREVPTNTTGELIILLYDNGKTEKVFND